MSYVLIEAEEGTTGDVFVAPSLDALLTVVFESYTQAIAALPTWNEGDRLYLPTRRTAILQVLAAATALEPGRHILKNRQGQWTEWTLIVPSGPASSHAFLA